MKRLAIGCMLVLSLGAYLPYQFRLYPTQRRDDAIKALRTLYSELRDKQFRNYTGRPYARPKVLFLSINSDDGLTAEFDVPPELREIVARVPGECVRTLVLAKMGIETVGEYVRTIPGGAVSENLPSPPGATLGIDRPEALRECLSVRILDVSTSGNPVLVEQKEFLGEMPPPRISASGSPMIVVGRSPESDLVAYIKSLADAPP